MSSAPIANISVKEKGFPFHPFKSREGPFLYVIFLSVFSMAQDVDTNTLAYVWSRACEVPSGLRVPRWWDPPLISWIVLRVLIWWLQVEACWGKDLEVIFWLD